MDNVTIQNEIFDRNLDALLHRKKEANKGDYKKLLIFGGSVGMAGAPFLSGLASFRSGIGMVRFIGPEENRTVLQTLLPEAMYTVFSYDSLRDALSWADMLTAGPGLSTEQEAVSYMETLYELLIQQEKKEMLLFDADALNIIAMDSLTGIYNAGNVIITPHIGEMARLTGKSINEIKENRKDIAMDYANKYGITVVLKDYVTVITDGKRTFESGDITDRKGKMLSVSCLSKAGSGDTLTGIISGVKAATKADNYEAACMGVHLHKLAAALSADKYGNNGILARDIADSIPKAIENY